MYIICKSSLHPMCLLILLHLTQKCSKLFSQFRHPALLFLVCLHSPYRTKLLIFHAVWYQHCFPPGCVPLVLFRFRTQIKTFSFYEQPHLSLPLSVTFLLYLQWRSRSTRNLFVSCSPQSSEKEDKVLPWPQSLKAPTACFLSPLSWPPSRNMLPCTGDAPTAHHVPSSWPWHVLALWPLPQTSCFSRRSDWHAHFSQEFKQVSHLQRSPWIKSRSCSSKTSTCVLWQSAWPPSLQKCPPWQRGPIYSLRFAWPPSLHLALKWCSQGLNEWTNANRPPSSAHSYASNCRHLALHYLLQKPAHNSQGILE